MLRPALVAMPLLLAAMPAAAGPIMQPAEHATAKALGFDSGRLAKILVTGARQHGQALIVKRRGKIALARKWGPQDSPHAMMQLTYPIVALAMGQLVAEGKVPSLDTPLGRWLPAFRGDKRAKITIRHVMLGRDHLTGPEPWPAALYRQPDYVAFYAKTPVGRYDNPGDGDALPRESVVLLDPVVRATAGMPLEQWVQTRLLAPLGIAKARWRHDKAGHLDAWAGLWLAPADALKIGELILNEGRWNGKQVLARDWVVEATTPVQRRDAPPRKIWIPGVKGPAVQQPPRAWDHAYGWKAAIRVRFREEDVAALQQQGCPEAAKLRPAIGTYHNHQDLQRVVLKLLGKTAYVDFATRRRRYPDWLPAEVTTDRHDGIEAADFIGNHLIINPAKQLVALYTCPWDGRPVESNIATYEFDDLADRLDEAAH